MRPIVLIPLLLVATPALAADKTPAKSPAAKGAAAKVDPRIRAEFDRTDTNHDGFLSREEIGARVARMDVGKTKMPPEQAKMFADRWFTTADANHDGKVSLYEMQGLFRAIASRYDLNHDGVISLDERAAARAAVIDGPKGAAPQGR
ncbi:MULTISPECIES: EF-hand domain-containing protein [unclassified Sphingomonas]|jgi:Ca2+-binding EF-hand superfamily protein|uniref:EF-hand domain-containing protein n=1 Tax=unclassified Sphingomonas TaxID=196159 RepID=UPI000E10E307|nr:MULTISPECIES: EF-hand domain-containing protein [unclassified Sphingomonas]AXJ95411.1 EF-hand domain-containing protein [Sphingomonas sp. FARSPH]